MISLPTTPVLSAPPPEVIQAIAEAAPAILDKASSDSSNAWKFLQRQRDSRKKEKWSWLSDIDIQPVVGNRAEVSFFYYCGYRRNTSRLRRYAVEHRIFVDGRQVFTKKLPGNVQRRSDAVSLVVRDFLPMGKIRNALVNGQQTTTLAVRIETVCNTTKIKKNHTDTASFHDNVKLDFTTAINEFVENQQSDDRASPSGSNQEPDTDSQSGNNGSSGVVLPPVALQLKQTNPTNDPITCPARIHFTARLKFRDSGEFTYFFDSNHHGKKTSPKTVKTNGSGMKDFYWNLPLSQPATTGQAAVVGWVRMNVHTRTERGRGFYQSQKIPFTVKCKPVPSDEPTYSVGQSLSVAQ